MTDTDMYLKLHSLIIFIVLGVVFYLLARKSKQVSLYYYCGYFACLCLAWLFFFIDNFEYKVVPAFAVTASFYLLYIAGYIRNNYAIKFMPLNIFAAFNIVFLSFSFMDRTSIIWHILPIVFFDMPILILCAFSSWRRPFRNIGDKLVIIAIVMFIAELIFSGLLSNSIGESIGFNHYFFAILAIIVGISLILSYLLESNRQIEQISSIDPLTGLLNRRGFEELAASQLALLTRLQLNVALIVIDIDHFKKINDRYGHVGGDEALKSMALLLTDNTRENDLVMRFGGEEFCILVSNADANQALVLAEKLRVKIQGIQIQFKQHSFGFTASFGVTSQTSAEFDLMAAIDCADRALYKAKASGRNKVMLAVI